MFDLSTYDLKYLPGVGTQRAALFDKELGIHSVVDLLHYYPYKHIDRSRIYAINEITGNMPYIQLKGRILSFESVGVGRQMRLVAHFSDDTGVVDLVWFAGAKYAQQNYKVQQEYIVFGKPSIFNGRYNIAHPEIEKADDVTLSNRGLQPFYITTDKMKKGSLNSHAIEKLVSKALSLIKDPIPETLTEGIIRSEHLMSLNDALQNIHFPQNTYKLRDAQYRLKFEELFYVQLNILRYASDRQQHFRGYIFRRVGNYFNTFYRQNLPFELTGAQKRVLREIRQDVGSGKQTPDLEAVNNGVYTSSGFDHTGVATISADGLTITAQNGVLYITTAVARDIDIVSASGMSFRHSLKAGQNAIAGLSRGVYVVAGVKVAL